MKLSWHKIPTTTWFQMPQKQQLLNVAAELARVSVGIARYGHRDQITRGAYERAFDLIDLTLEDSRWESQSLQWRYLRDVLASLYQGGGDRAVLNFLYNWLVKTSENI